MLFFAFSQKGSFSIKEISERLKIPEKVMEQVLLSLKNRGFLSSKRGPQGGYRLSGDISGLTVMDIIEAGGKRLDVFPVGNRKTAVDEVLESMKDYKPEVLALSGFLTLAFDSMKEVIQKIRDSGLRDSVKIMIGGGTVDERIVEYVGADAYGESAVDAVNLAKEWI